VNVEAFPLFWQTLLNIIFKMMFGGGGDDDDVND
jgi:hypothetical protein